MKDFEFEKYRDLLLSLQKQGFSFQTFNEFLQKHEQKVVILRHDVDLLPGNSLQTAQIENNLGIKGSYYFRKVPKSYNKGKINSI